MCNLYSITTNQEAIRALFRVMNRYIGNLQAMPGVFPDYPAPVVRNVGTEREHRSWLDEAGFADIEIQYGAAPAGTSIVLARKTG
ncbi:putative SOS response-associated peptidase YedK [Bradyrhizobium sp. AZCC 1578]